jgi:2-phosphosulfolactate phosphatase
MKVSYFHTTDLILHTETPDAAIVIDVLRVLTTILLLLHHGRTETVKTFDNLNNLHKAAAAWPNSIMAGEHGGKKVPDFHLGNSPLAVSASLVSRKQIFFSTINGTQALQRV